MKNFSNQNKAFLSETKVGEHSVSYERMFKQAALRNGSLYQRNKDTPVKQGVIKISVGTRYNMITRCSGLAEVYTPQWQFLAAGVRYCVAVGNILALSDMPIEQNMAYHLVSGRCISIFGADGAKIHDNVRGVMGLDARHHLVRYADGTWMLCLKDGSPMRNAPLCKLNVTAGAKTFMFDDRGKLRLGMHSIYYGNCSY